MQEQMLNQEYAPNSGKFTSTVYHWNGRASPAAIWYLALTFRYCFVYKLLQQKTLWLIKTVLAWAAYNTFWKLFKEGVCVGLVDNSVEDGERIVIDDTLTVPYFHHQVIDLQKIIDTIKVKIDFDIQLQILEGVSLFYSNHPTFFTDYIVEI